MEEQKIFILKLNLYNIEGRYPDDIARIYKITNEKLAKS